MNRLDPQFDPRQRAEAIEAIEKVMWGDVGADICSVDLTMRQLLDVTADDLERWETELGPPLEDRGYDEFDVPAETVAAMTAEQKLAWVARLVYSLTLLYGVTGGLCAEPNSVAALLCALNDISAMPVTERG